MIASLFSPTQNPAGSSPARALLSAALEGVLRRFAALDPDAPRLLAPLAGRVVEVHLDPPGVALFLSATESAPLVLESCPDGPDVCFTASPTAFARQMTRSGQRDALFTGEIVIHGDLALARDVQRLFERLDFDWEEHLAHLTGDFVARSTLTLARTARDWLGAQLESSRLDLAEFLTEEGRDTPTAAEIARHCRAVDALRDDCDRLAARVTRLGETRAS